MNIMERTIAGGNKTSIEVKMRKAFSLLLFILTVLSSVQSASAQKPTRHEPIVIEKQGSFAVGGTVITAPGTFDPYNPSPAGQTFHGDHAYVFYQIPMKARKYPLIMVAWFRPVFQNVGNNA